MHRQNLAPARRDDRAGRRAGRAAARGRDRAVPRLGVREPRRADADPRAGAARRRNRGRGARTAAGGSSSTTCPPTTTPRFPSPAWAAGARPGSTSPPTAACCPATRRRRSRGSRSSGARRPLAAIWEDGPGLRGLPRRRLDAGALPELRAARDRLRRLPLPGDGARRRRRAATDPVCMKSPLRATIAAMAGGLGPGATTRRWSGGGSRPRKPPSRSERLPVKEVLSCAGFGWTSQGLTAIC